MAIASLFTLLDDITSLLDDVAGMTKLAASKTAGVVGDDLALNAQQVMGTAAERELPVVWSVAKGSFVNKAILVPVAIALSAFLPVLITPLLMLGGLYLCFEGAEKLMPHHAEAATEPLTEAQKIRGAIRTDFILSAEIIILALGIVAEEVLATRILTLTIVGVGMTIIVYGLVGAIVKLDDFGLYLTRKANAAARGIGAFILKAAPWLMRSLGVIGTAAMFMVGGQILIHGIPALHHLLEEYSTGLIGMVVSGIFGVLCGFAAAGIYKTIMAIRARIN